MSQSKEEINLQNKRNKIPKMNKIREINNVKSLMDKRKEQRSLTIFNLAAMRFQTALIIARQLLFTSQKIWKQFQDEFIEEFQENHFFRTSKNKQHTQYLLDSSLICLVFIKSKKKDDVLEVIQKIEIPQVKIINKNDVHTKEDKIRYNQMKQILCRTCSALLSFIEITKHEKFNGECTEKLFNYYTDFVQKYYGPFEYATSKFLYANYLYENQKHVKALQMYEVCLKIRKQNCLNEAFVDVLVNSAVCMRQLGQIKSGIERMKLAIEIAKDLKKSTESIIDEYHLFLAKLYLENADFKQSYKNYLITYKMRQQLHIQDPQKVQIEVNLLFFYKTLQKCVQDYTEQYFNLKDRKQVDVRKKQAQQIINDMGTTILNRQQFSKYDDFNKKMAHLNLVIPQAFFDLLTSEQVSQLNTLLIKLSSCSFPKGVNELKKCSFYQQKKAKEMLLAANPIINTYKGKNNINL